MNRNASKFSLFAGNFPKIHDVKAIKAAGKRCMAFASTDQISEQMIRFGCDALILEGSEAGGHIGHVSTMILLQQILFKTKDVPVFVAGGIGTGKMIAHMLLMGAAGVQLGTKFVVTEECTAHENFKKAFIKAKARHAVSTPEYDSRLHVVSVRALKNKSMDNFGKLQLELLTRPVLEYTLKHRLYARSDHVSEKTVDDWWDPVRVPGTRRAALRTSVCSGARTGRRDSLSSAGITVTGRKL